MPPVNKFTLKSCLYRYICGKGLFIPLLFIIWYILHYLLSSSSSSETRIPNNYKFSLLNGRDRINSLHDGEMSLFKKLSNIDTLIMVPGHAVLQKLDLNQVWDDENSWYLLPYQKGHNFPQIIKQHISEAIDLTIKNDNSILIFSGGETRANVGPLSEGASYFFAANTLNKMKNHLQGRVYIEEHARDSFENLIFSICRFKEVTGTYPSKIYVVGFDFKRQRYENLHRYAIGYPSQSFKYIGLKPENELFPFEDALNGEKEAVENFKNDYYGCSNELFSKIVKRNPFIVPIPYELTAPELRDLLHWCGPQLYTEAHTSTSKSVLPWLMSQRERKMKGLRGSSALKIE